MDRIRQERAARELGRTQEGITGMVYRRRMSLFPVMLLLLQCTALQIVNTLRTDQNKYIESKIICYF